MGKIDRTKKKLDFIEASFEYNNIDAIIEKSISEISNLTESDYSEMITNLCMVLSLTEDASEEVNRTEKELDFLFEQKQSILTEINLSEKEKKERIVASLLLFPFFEGIAIILSTILGVNMVDCFQLFTNISLILLATFGINASYLTSELRTNRYIAKEEEKIKEIIEFQRALKMLKLAESTAAAETNAYLKRLQELTPASTPLGVPYTTHITNTCQNYEYDITITHTGNSVKKRVRKRDKK